MLPHAMGGDSGVYNMITRTALTNGGSAADYEHEAKFGPHLDCFNCDFEESYMPITGFPLTLTAWVRPTNMTATYGMLGIGQNGSSATDTIQLRIVSTPAFQMRRNFNADASIAVTDTGEFRLVIGTCWAADDATLWVDGPSNKDNTTVSISPTFTNFDTIEVASQIDGGGKFYGDILDMRVYNRAFDDADALHMWDPQTRWDLYKKRSVFGPFTEIVIPADLHPDFIRTRRPQTGPFHPAHVQ